MRRYGGTSNWFPRAPPSSFQLLMRSLRHNDGFAYITGMSLNTHTPWTSVHRETAADFGWWRMALVALFDRWFSCGQRQLQRVPETKVCVICCQHLNVILCYRSVQLFNDGFQTNVLNAYIQTLMYKRLCTNAKTVQNVMWQWMFFSGSILVAAHSPVWKHWCLETTCSQCCSSRYVLIEYYY